MFLAEGLRRSQRTRFSNRYSGCHIEARVLAVLRRAVASSGRELSDLAGRRRKARTPTKIEELLGPLEAEVMNIIWVRGPSLVSEVEELLNRRRSEPLAYKTYLTICTRLSEKGLLAYHKEGRAFRYSAVMSETEFVSHEAGRAADVMLQRFGRVALSSFVDRVAADPEQLAALRNLLDDQ